MNQTDFLNYVKTNHPTIKNEYYGAARAKGAIDQIGGWSDFCERAEDIARFGADGGERGFIRIVECERFVAANWPYLAAIGWEYLPSIIAKSDGPEMMSSNLAWFGLATVAGWFVEWQEGGA